ncbi:8-amino-7-oxononanoate synthase [Novosphingopyxis iocasae]|uniref:8-amino-7-oxononanoate synthase n=1 Tax=Novosphingopyxis iocasae TaxID=2762729 RepID=UPI001FEC7DFF|nr:8-amino-7-oxononanoate synthase [Novosphingopyxis iocasae]
MTFLDFYQQDIQRLEQAGRRRTLALPAGRDFSSNDYLGLAGSDVLRGAAIAALERGVPLGSGGSRLLRGHGSEHQALEEEAARFFGAPSALYVGSGFAANSLLFATLPQPDDLILYDALIHASAHEGMRLSRAPARSFEHNDVAAAEAAIAEWRREGGRGTVWIAFETLYSMDGDTAPVAEFAALAERESTMLLVDEAHAVGACGPQGRGLAAEIQGHENAVLLATCGKALGCEGALILAPAPLRDFLINRGRSFIFSTAPSPLMAAVVRAALAATAMADERRTRLRTLIATAKTAFAPLGITPGGTHIQPIILGDDTHCMTVAAALQARGFDVRGIRPPSVPPGTARLRVSITLNTDEAAIHALADTLKELL